VSQFNPADSSFPVLPGTYSTDTKALAVRLSADEQSSSGANDRYLSELFTDLTHPTGTSSIGIGVPVQNAASSITVPDYTSAGASDAGRQDTLVTAAPPKTGLTTGMRDRASVANPRTDKITADEIAAPPRTAIATSVRDRASVAGLRTNKIAAAGSASVQGFVKDAKGEPIKGADVQVESRDGKQMFSTVTTDPNGRYNSQGLQPGVYRVTLLVNGEVKASIMNTQTKANQPTQLNFDLKPASQAGNIAKGGKRMVWVPARTGSHIGGNWVEVEDSGKAHRGSNVQTVTARNW
jgi:Carboxypeptidase regulatory-like domain